MSQHYDTSFDEELLSGYLDGELTQADEQRVRLHLEDNAQARDLVAEMRRIREAARTTELPAPADEEWNEAPRSGGSQAARRIGWFLVIGWCAVIIGLVAWGFLNGPDHWWQKALLATVLAGPILLFASVLMDRLKAMEDDRYRRVEK